MALVPHSMHRNATREVDDQDLRRFVTHVSRANRHAEDPVGGSFSRWLTTGGGTKLHYPGGIIKSGQQDNIILANNQDGNHTRMVVNVQRLRGAGWRNIPFGPQTLTEKDENPTRARWVFLRTHADGERRAVVRTGRGGAKWTYRFKSLRNGTAQYRFVITIIAIGGQACTIRTPKPGRTAIGCRWDGGGIRGFDWRDMVAEVDIAEITATNDGVRLTTLPVTLAKNASMAVDPTDVDATDGGDLLSGGFAYDDGSDWIDGSYRCCYPFDLSSIDGGDTCDDVLLAVTVDQNNTGNYAIGPYDGDGANTPAFDGTPSLVYTACDTVGRGDEYVTHSDFGTTGEKTWDTAAGGPNGDFDNLDIVADCEAQFGALFVTCHQISGHSNLVELQEPFDTGDEPRISVTHSVGGGGDIVLLRRRREEN